MPGALGDAHNKCDTTIVLDRTLKKKIFNSYYSASPKGQKTGEDSKQENNRPQICGTSTVNLNAAYQAPKFFMSS
ncbi:hypothetical protein N8348_02720, partial [Litorivicinus sp.]|nr:hypothetical protein [Litorivicinus sp.]